MIKNMIKKFFSSTKEENREESEKLMQNIEIQIRSKLKEIKYVKERSCSTDPNVRRDALDDLKFLEEEHEMLLEEYYELEGTISLSRHKNSQVREIKRKNINLKKQKQKLEWQLKRLEDKLYYFESKAGRKKWVNDLRDKVLMVEKWKYDIITKESSLCNKEIDLLTDLKLAERSEEKKLILEGVIIRLNRNNKEIQELKQELVSQTANNIILKDELNKILKDELNKLKNINN